MASRVITSPIGPLLIEAGADGLRRVEFWRDALPELATRADDDPAALQHLDAACQQLGEYFAGERLDFDLTLSMQGTPFRKQVWDAIASIPYGLTESYAGVAAMAGSPGAYRAAGSACGANRIAIVVPCHRVVGANGSLHGFGGGLDTKAWLLEHERRVAGTPVRQPSLV